VACVYWGGVSNTGIRFSGIESSIFIFVVKERKTDQIIIIHLEESLGIVLFVPANDYSRRYFPLVKKV